ncbi:MAG TPA: hypothetical protein VF221_11530 [Chloroflexota bacterium]
MRLGMRATGSALAQVATHFSASLLANLVAFVLSLPLFLAIGILAFGTRSYSLIPLGVALLIGVLPNPCTAGVHAVANGLASDGYTSASEHWRGLRRYARPAAVAWLLSVLVSAVIVGNLAFYAHAGGSAQGALRILAAPLFCLWLLMFVSWLALHVYVFPLLMQQERTSVALAYRNAALMAMTRPAVLIVVLPIWLFVLVLSSATGLATFIGIALGASIQHQVTVRLLPTFERPAAA